MTDFADLDGVIWFDGEWVPWREAKVHVLTHTLHYGSGIYEGIRAYQTERGPAIYRLPEHMQRFINSAKIIQMSMPFDSEQLQAAAVEAVARNQLKSAYIRPMAFLGSEGMGLHAQGIKTHVIIAAWEWGKYYSAEAQAQGLRVKVASIRRNPVDSLFSQAKVAGHYVNSTLALHEVKAGGYDEALLLDHNGYIAEGSGENFFLVDNNTVHTPHHTHVLRGITRDSIMTFCRDLEIPMTERNITRDEAYVADEAFFTGTAVEVVPIRECDDRTIGSGSRGAVTERLQQLYFDVVCGKVDNYRHWLTYV